MRSEPVSITNLPGARPKEDWNCRDDDSKESEKCTDHCARLSTSVSEIEFDIANQSRVASTVGSNFEHRKSPSASICSIAVHKRFAPLASCRELNERPADDTLDVGGREVIGQLSVEQLSAGRE